jgi:hypothetical protein
VCKQLASFFRSTLRAWHRAWKSEHQAAHNDEEEAVMHVEGDAEVRLAWCV